ncbi:hypothetical protein MD484_g2345, partial [Candolleomyces efflorescens]
MRYGDTPHYALSVTFAAISQLVFFVADGLLVYRCYLVFIDRRAVYIPLMVNYAANVIISLIEIFPLQVWRRGKDKSYTITEVEFDLVASNILPSAWFVTSLATNILVTGFIIFRIFHRVAPPTHATQLLNSDEGVAQVVSGVAGENGGDFGRSLAIRTRISNFWRRWRNKDRWNSRSWYSRVIAVLIQAALAPALCGTAALIFLYTPWKISRLSQQVTYRLLLTLWLATSVYRCYLVFIDRRAVYLPIMAVYAICVVNSMVELYPLTLLLNEYVPVPGSGHENLLWPKRKNGDGWQWQSLYTRVVVILIEAALPPALCGIASMITFFSRDTVMTKQWQRDGRDWSQEMVVRLFMTLWLGTSVLAPQLIAIHTLRKKERSMLGAHSLSTMVATTERHRLSTLVFRDEHGVETRATNEVAGIPESAIELPNARRALPVGPS